MIMLDLCLSKIAGVVIMKKTLKIAGTLILAIVTVVSIIKLIQLVRKYSLCSILKGFMILSSDDVDLIEVSENGTKFLAKKTQEGVEAFDEYLNEIGYQFIGQFGSSNLYEFDGMEIVIKRTGLFGKYYLYEIFNERYFEETDAYIVA